MHFLWLKIVDLNSILIVISIIILLLLLLGKVLFQRLKGIVRLFVLKSKKHKVDGGVVKVN